MLRVFDTSFLQRSLTTRRHAMRVYGQKELVLLDARRDKQWVRAFDLFALFDICLLPGLIPLALLISTVLFAVSYDGIAAVSVGQIFSPLYPLFAVIVFGLLCLLLSRQRDSTLYHRTEGCLSTICCHELHAGASTRPHSYLLSGLVALGVLLTLVLVHLRLDGRLACSWALALLPLWLALGVGA